MDEQPGEKGKKMIGVGAILMTLAVTIHGLRVYQRGPTAVKEPWAIVATIIACLGLVVFSFGLALTVNTGFDKRDLSQ